MCVTFTSCFVIFSERRWRRGWRGWRRSELLWRIQWLGLGLAPPPPPHWRGQAVQATPPRTLIIPADQREVVTSYCGRAGPSHLPSEGGGAWRSVLLHLFQFLSSVCWFLSDGRRRLFYFLEQWRWAGFVQSWQAGEGAELIVCY